MSVPKIFVVTFLEYSSVQVGSSLSRYQFSALRRDGEYRGGISIDDDSIFGTLKFKIHSQGNKYVVRRFSSIDFGLPGGLCSSRHDNDTPLGLIFAANLQKGAASSIPNVPHFPLG